MRKVISFFTAGFLLIASSAGELFASRATEAERSLLLRAATGTLSKTSSSDNAQAQPLDPSISAGLSTNSVSYNNLYNTRFRQRYDAAQTIYEDAVKKELIKRKALLFPAKAQRIPSFKEGGAGVESRIVGEENAYLKLLAERETRKKLQEVEKAKEEKRVSKALPKPALAEKMKPLFTPTPAAQQEAELLEKESRPFTNFEKMDIVSRLVKLVPNESDASSMVAVFDNRKEFRQALKDYYPDMSEEEREWVLKGGAEFPSM